MDDVVMDSSSTITNDDSQHSSDQALNAAQSLREAALLTLKSKRSSRKTVASLPPRPLATFETSFLDYGQEETTPATINSAEVRTPATPPEEEASHDLENSSDVEDGQIREEGEISDIESTPIALARPLDPDPLPSSQKLNVKSEPTTPNLSHTAKAPQQASTAPRLIVNQVSVDADHVRPGLALNQTQYDTAKDIVLDLLGWAVPPDYLLSCGLSREIIFYVFSELNLRLPENLDLTGLIPFPPFPVSPVSTNCEPSTPTIPRRPASRPELETIDTTSPTLIGHPSLPPKPVLTPPAIPTSTEAPIPSLPPAAAAMDLQDMDLQDMETQRRQELQARKAVQASRKSKSNSSQDTDGVMMIPLASVDDFLKSIESVDTPMEIAVTDSIRFSSPEGMDVDQSVQLEHDHRSHSSTTADSVPPSTASSAASFEEPVPSSSDSVSLTFKELSPPLVDVDIPITTSVRSRGTKRPVAADFVDFESGSIAQPSNGYTNGGLTQSNLSTRRKTANGASFASVSGMRRCVIDLSDSDGEGESSSQLRVNTNPTSRTQSPGRFLAPSSAVTPGWATPLSTTTPADTMSPAALMEKEEEIRRMKAKIEQKEQKSRSRKLLSATRSMSNTYTEIASVAVTPAPSSPVERPEDSNTSDSNRNGISNGEEIIPDTGADNNNVNDFGDAANPPIDDSPELSISSSGQTDVLQEPEMPGDTLISRLPEDSMLAEDYLSPTAAFTEYELTTEKKSSTTFCFYKSLFGSYPLLRSEAHPMSSSEDLSGSGLVSFESTSSFTSSSFASISTSSSSILPFSLPSFKSLRLATTAKLLDPSKRICRYETGGGVCRDKECEDVHLDKMGIAASGVEPNDQDTVEYLSTTIPLSWQHQNNVTAAKMSTALQDARRAWPQLLFEDRVAQALMALVSIVPSPAS